ncbi:hypothetical protein GIB67_013452 [Kingdonia uniflora]|uniref:Phytocyanin domain-containing protein n=1 Tax=Kingdonia uniflora TaxID=39325 RepID=A0A7J7LR19_9MAGN|nr:hypothetical protein GIB67_013452 [Kingdonia uniflora]
MASLFTTKRSVFSLLVVIFISIACVSVSVSAFEFKIGGKEGWVKPNGNENETYDDWATQNRFHIGDSVHFKYENDSVVVVNKTAFQNCDLSDPIMKFEDGGTVFRFERYGFFYFISGVPGHCKSGQKIVIRVMVHPEVMPPRFAPSPHGGGAGAGAPGPGGSGGDWRPSTPNSTHRVQIGSYLMSALGGIIFVLYLFF